MNSPTLPRTTSSDWDSLRTAFASSIMVDTALHSLAQNLDGPDWPLHSKDETPATYVDLDLGSVIDLLALKGQPPTIVDSLASILRETLAFDEPFGEMLAQSETPKPGENTLLRNLTRLGIPEDFPIKLCALSEDTKAFCRLEEVDTIGQFALFSQGMAQNVIVGGDFRSLLNALAHVDEETLARFIPLRRASKGIFLPEAIALSLRCHTAGIQMAMAARAGFNVRTKDHIRVGSDLVDTAQAELRIRCAELCSGWFKAQALELKSEVEAGTPLTRLLTVLDDPAAETVVAAALKKVLLTPHEPARPQQGFWLRLFTRFQHA